MLDAAGNRWDSYDQYLLSGHWRQMRQRAFQVFGKRCVLCGRAEGLHVHHRTYENFGKEDPAKDLIVICEPCHNLFHNKFKYKQSDHHFTHKSSGKKKKKKQKQKKNKPTPQEKERKHILRTDPDLPFWKFIEAVVENNPKNKRPMPSFLRRMVSFPTWPPPDHMRDFRQFLEYYRSYLRGNDVACLSAAWSTYLQRQRKLKQKARP